MDNIRNRVRQAMEWLKDNRLFNSNRVIAEKMGYNPSVVSQVITGKSKVTERFVKSLCSIYQPLSFDWIWNGPGISVIQLNKSPTTSLSSLGGCMPLCRHFANSAKQSSVTATFPPNLNFIQSSLELHAKYFWVVIP